MQKSRRASYLEILFGVLIGIGGACGLANAEDSEYSLTLDKAPKLCRSVLDLARKLAATDGSLCAFPGDESDTAIVPLNWQSIAPLEIDALLARKLPRFGWKTRESLSDLWTEGKAAGKNVEEIQTEIWVKVGLAMKEALTQGPASLSRTNADVDNDGVSELIYEVTTLEPNDVSDISSGWHPLACSRDPTRHPYYSFFFETQREASMGVLSLPELQENHRLLLYQGKTYLAYVTSTMVAVSSVGRGPSGVFVDPVCNVLGK
jgi:hypothetical protein